MAKFTQEQMNKMTSILLMPIPSNYFFMTRIRGTKEFVITLFDSNQDQQLVSKMEVHAHWDEGVIDKFIQLFFEEINTLGGDHD